MRARGAGQEWLVLSIVAAALAAAAAPSPTADKPDASAAANGEVTYVRYCVACHGKAARGDGPLAEDLRVPVPDLTTLAARSKGSYPYDRVVRIITSGEPVRGHGSADMPAWGDAFKKTKGTDTRSVDAAVRNLAHYLWSVQQAVK